jgi:hypothetical protein
MRLAGVLGMGALDERWQEVTGAALPAEVRRYVEASIAEGDKK